MTNKVQKIRKEVEKLHGNPYYMMAVKDVLAIIDSLQEEPISEDYKIYGSVAAVKALDRKRVCPQLKGNALHKFKNEFNTIKQIVHLLYNYEDPFCYRVALHWAFWGAYNLKSFGNMNEKEKVKMDISEKPAPKIFEDMLNAKTAAESLGISAEEHDKIIDLCLYGKEPELVDIDDLPKEEPVSEDLEKASKEWLAPQLDKSYAAYGEVKMMELTHFDGYAMLDAIEFGVKWQKTKDESTTEDLGEYINELSKQFPEVSFAKLSRIAVRVAKWQKEYMMNEIKIRLVDTATNQDNSTDIGEQTYYNGMVDALGRLRDKFMED